MPIPNIDKLMKEAGAVTLDSVEKQEIVRLRLLYAFYVQSENAELHASIENYLIDLLKQFKP